MKTGILFASIVTITVCASALAEGQIQPPAAGRAPAAGAPAPSATAAPTSAPARHVLQIPPGFKVVTVTGRSVLCEPADEDWMRQQLLVLQPATRPTTSP